MHSRVARAVTLGIVCFVYTGPRRSKLALSWLKLGACSCDLWKRGQIITHGARPFWTGQIVRLATTRLGWPWSGGNCSRTSSTAMRGAASCGRCHNFHDDIRSGAASHAGGDKGGDGQHLLLWKASFQDQRRRRCWCDNDEQQQQRSNLLRWPEFVRHHEEEEESGGAGWPLGNKSDNKPAAWVDLMAAASSASPRSLSLSWGGDAAEQQQRSGWSGLEQRVLARDAVKKLCELGQAKGAVDALQQMLVRTRCGGIDKHLVYTVLKECMAKNNLVLGGEVHALAVRLGFGSDTFLCNHFIRMYAGHGKLAEAMDVFRGVALPDVFMWASIISAHVKQKQAEQAIQLYQQMPAAAAAGTMRVNGFVVVAALQACAAAGDLQLGKKIHKDVLSSGMGHDDMFVWNCLVDMYVKCGSLEDARAVFDGLGDMKDVVTWNAMIAGYAKQEGSMGGQEALDLYGVMLKEGVVAPDSVTFVCLLQACANVGFWALETGKRLHSQLLKERRVGAKKSAAALSGSLVNMYVKCGSLEDARTVFDGLGGDMKDVVTWTAMIAGYAQEEGMGQEALDLHCRMRAEGMACPDAVTFVCLLQACANVGVSALEQGKQLHRQLKERGGHEEEFDVVVGGSLVNMYVKCGSVKDARMVFEGLREKNVVAWNAMIAGYAEQEGMGQEALNLYGAMRKDGTTSPDAVTYACLVDACAGVAALQQGKELHREIGEAGLGCDAVIGRCLVKMYAKCGCLEAARQVFDSLLPTTKDVVTWNVLLKGYAEHGEAGMAIKCFQELLEEQGVQPDEVTYTCLLTACSHAGLVEQGQHYFETMAERHGVEPNEQHLNCMVDLYGRSGQVEKAEQMLRASGASGSAVSWTALLSACKRYGDAETGRRCFEHLVKLEPRAASAYVLLGSMYARAGRWDEVGRVEVLRKAAGARKMAAKACIEVKKEVHEFTVGEERLDLGASVRKVVAQNVKEGGHVPQTEVVLLSGLCEEEKEDALCGHAEKLALAYGLLNTPAGSTLVVTKNLRMCDDCHSSTKVLSRVEKREIVVRDGHKVHRFGNGACSCRDRP